MIKFSIADYYGHSHFIIMFLDMQEQFPHYFYEDRKIDSAYGMPSGLIWNGGRAFLKQTMTQEEAYNIFDNYQKYKDFHLRHTCTNCLLTEQMYADHNCNTWIGYCQKPGDGIIVNDDKLMQYLQQRYPHYNYIISTTKQIKDIDTYNQYSKNYLTVLDYNFNHDEQFLSQLKYPQNIEILCAEPCIDNCPNRTEHYKLISAAQLNIPHTPYFSCPNVHDEEYCVSAFYEKHLKYKHAITTEYVDYLYKTYGFNNFKISGRVSNPINYVEAIIYYLIKPEYQNIVRNAVLSMTFF